MDMSGFTIPTDALAPAGYMLNTAVGYILSKRVWINWRLAGIVEFGNTVDDRSVAPITARVSNLNATAIDASTNKPGSNIGSDDYRRANASYLNTTNSGVFWAGVPNAPTTTPADVFSPGYPSWTGPPGPAGLNTGDGVAVENQNVINTVHLQGQVAIGGTGLTSMSCVTFDNSLTAISSFPVPSGVNPPQQGVGNDGVNDSSPPVWISGSTSKRSTPRTMPTDSGQSSFNTPTQVVGPPRPPLVKEPTTGTTR